MKNVKMMLFATITMFGLMQSINAMLQLKHDPNGQKYTYVYVDDRGKTYTFFEYDLPPEGDSMKDIGSKIFTMGSKFNKNEFFASNPTLKLIPVRKITMKDSVGFEFVAERNTLYIDYEPRTVEISKMVKKGSVYEQIMVPTPGRYSYDVIPTKDLGDKKDTANTDYVIILYSSIRGVTVTKENGETLKLLQQ